MLYLDYVRKQKKMSLYDLNVNEFFYIYVSGTKVNVD